MQHHPRWPSILRSRGWSTFASQSTWLVAEKAVKIALLLAVGTWMAKVLGPQDFGELGYAIAFVALFHGVVTLSADGIVVHDLVRTPEEAARILGTVLHLRLAIGALCWLLAVVAVWAWAAPGDRTVLLVAVIGATLVFQAADTIDLWFQSQGRMALAAGARICAYLLSNAVRVWLIVVDAPLLAFGVLAGAEAAIVAVILMLVYRRHRSSMRWASDARIGARLLRQCWPLILGSLAAAGYLRADQVLIRNVLGSSALGLYVAALQISQVAYVLPMVLATALGPKVAGWHAHAPVLFERRIIVVFRLFFYAGLAFGILVAAMAGPLVQLLFGSDYSTAAAVLAIHAFCSPFVFLGTAHNLWLWNTGRLHVRLIGTLLAGTMSVALNLALLPTYGLVGAAWVAIASQFLSTFAINAWLAPRSFMLQLAAIFFVPAAPLSSPGQRT